MVWSHQSFSIILGIRIVFLIIIMNLESIDCTKRNGRESGRELIGFKGYRRG